VIVEDEDDDFVGVEETSETTSREDGVEGDVGEEDDDEEGGEPFRTETIS